jgi:hypothetical protein
MGLHSFKVGMRWIVCKGVYFGFVFPRQPAAGGFLPRLGLLLHPIKTLLERLDGRMQTFRSDWGCCKILLKGHVESARHIQNRLRLFAAANPAA